MPRPQLPSLRPPSPKTGKALDTGFTSEVFAALRDAGVDWQPFEPPVVKSQATVDALSTGGLVHPLFRPFYSSDIVRTVTPVLDAELTRSVSWEALPPKPAHASSKSPEALKLLRKMDGLKPPSLTQVVRARFGVQRIELTRKLQRASFFTR